MRRTTITTLLLILASLTPAPADACLGTPLCPIEMGVERIACKTEASSTVASESTCSGWSAQEAKSWYPRTVVDVSGYVDITIGYAWGDGGGLMMALWEGRHSGERLLAWELVDDVYIWPDVVQPRGDAYGAITIRNVPSARLPLLTGRCVSAADPASRTFYVFADLYQADISYLPATRAFQLRIAADGFVNPPHCP